MNLNTELNQAPSDSSLVIEFGDGYKQVVSDGINSETQSWPYSYLTSASFKNSDITIP
ncbi:hypothetical protein XBO1_2160001 [Xenorhabdus bovienii str. oregonense]|uniref:Uncharacterized protein n=1 Tax=Xenorhabdus bovienii str. oregonense TaxID=1398202 RepID=A0A077P8Y6_XENBV|nr:hypothetical protein XBO1_2160001 [Xenorhabdus bovienii str. oregonense]